jgi:hypothetical protein
MMAMRIGLLLYLKAGTEACPANLCESCERNIFFDFQNSFIKEKDEYPVAFRGPSKGGGTSRKSRRPVQRQPP